MNNPAQPPDLARMREKRRGRTKDRICHVCGQTALFCWTCRCGFAICQSCMLENVWAMSCNGIDWHCPDCGALNGFGNQ